MAKPYTWTYDAPSGTYKSHELSGDLLKLAALKLKIVPFTKKISNFGRKQGETITLPYYKAAVEPTSAQLEEETRIPIDQLLMGTYTITIKNAAGRGNHFALPKTSLFFPPTMAHRKCSKIKCL